MIILDTSGLLASIDDSERTHAAARAVVERDAGPLILSPFVLAELDYLLAEKNVAAEAILLGEVAEGLYRLEPFDAEDVGRALELVERYRDLRIGLADASLVVLAARNRTTRILTLDERRFRAIRPLRGAAFTILPADA
ncbi:MAG: PIN domain-containing protein [Candidatus Limnocylindria bacterium]